MQKRKSLARSHWVKLLSGLRPVLRRPTRKLPVDLRGLLLTVAMVLLTAQATTSTDRWFQQSSQDILRVLEMREILKF